MQSLSLDFLLITYFIWLYLIKVWGVMCAASWSSGYVAINEFWMLRDSSPIVHRSFGWRFFICSNGKRNWTKSAGVFFLRRSGRKSSRNYKYWDSTIGKDPVMQSYGLFEHNTYRFITTNWFLPCMFSDLGSLWMNGVQQSVPSQFLLTAPVFPSESV